MKTVDYDDLVCLDDITTIVTSLCQKTYHQVNSSVNKTFVY